MLERTLLNGGFIELQPFRSKLVTDHLECPSEEFRGSVGSWSADILFSAFGILAFAIPALLLLGCWAIFQYESQRRYIDFSLYR